MEKATKPKRARKETPQPVVVSVAPSVSAATPEPPHGVVVPLTSLRLKGPHAGVITGSDYVPVDRCDWLRLEPTLGVVAVKVKGRPEVLLPLHMVADMRR